MQASLIFRYLGLTSRIAYALLLPISCLRFNFFRTHHCLTLNTTVMTTYYKLTIVMKGSEKKHYSLIYGTLEKVLCVWSEYYAKDDAVDHAFITRYSDEDAPGQPKLDRNFNKEADAYFDKPFITLK